MAVKKQAGRLAVDGSRGTLGVGCFKPASRGFRGFQKVGKKILKYLVPQTTSFKWMFGEITISYIKIWNHPIETTICNTDVSVSR